MTTTPPPVAIRPSAGGKPPKTPLSAAQATEEMESPATPGSRVHCVLTWGVNEDGQLGHDHNEDIIIPTIVKGLKDYKLRDPEPMVAPLIASSRNTLAICEDGELYTWGWNARGTLGHGHKESEFRPRKVASLAGVKIMQAHIGGWHSLAVSEDGQAFAFGGNEYLQCGVQNPPDERDIITPVACLPTIRVRHVSAGGMHSVAVTTEGTVFQWGQPFSVTSYSDQELSKPRLVPGLVDVKYVSAGAFHNVAVTHAGSVKSWGHNEYGQLGVGNTTYADVPIDIEALHEVGVKEVACGGWHSCAITEGGSLYVWGRGEYGRLGLGDHTAKSRLLPVLNEFFEEEGRAVADVSCGGTHSIALLRDGRVFVWGRATYGRLGTHREENCAEPVELELPGNPKVLSVTAGGRHSCAYVCYYDRPPPIQRQLSRGKSIRKPNV